MKKCILVLLIILPQIVCANNLKMKCNGSTVQVYTMNKTPYGYEKVILKVKKGNDEIKLLFHGVHFGIEYRKNPNGKYFLIFQAYCGGSSCRDLDNYGIIDTSDFLRVLLVPNNTNRITASKIFGKELYPVKTMDS